jgi:peptidoglycan/LPS O-acetylase OafA/YrhL
MRMPDRDSAIVYRPDIDGLRGMAVALVVAYHAFPKFRTGGFIGVDVFFVISGYLITQIILTDLQAKTFSLAEFYRRRVRRIVPALLVVMAVCCIFGWLLLLPSELQWLGKSISWCAPFLANVFFARTGAYFDRAAELNPLLHLWSLGVEEQFYLAWPVLLILMAKYRMTKLALAAVIATSLAISIWGGWYAPTPFFYYPISRGWELGVGGLLAAWQLGTLRKPAADDSSGRSLDAHARWSVSQASSLVGLALITAGGMFWTADKPIPGIWSVIPTTGAALLIAAGSGTAVNRWFLGCRPMMFVGRISYPLYLWHWPLFSFTRVVLGRAPPPAMAASAIVLAFAAAYVTYRYVEIPIRYGELARKAVPGLLTGLAAVALLGAAANVRWIHGRLSGPTFAAWDEAVTDWHFSGENIFDRRSGFTLTQVPSHGSGKALFIGDSHIQQYWPRVAHVIDMHPDSARTAVFVTKEGCPPLPGVNARQRGRNCDRLFDFAMEQALRRDVDTVVFGAFWEDYFLGEYLVNAPRPRVYNVADNARETLGLDSPGTQVAFEQFQRSVSRLVSSGRRVFIVLSNPTSPLFDPLFPPEIRLSPHVSRSFHLGSGPRIDAGPFESYVAPLMSRLRNIAAQTGAKAVDPRLALCDGMICPATDSDGMPRYLDSNHLRGFAARERASFIDEMLLGRDTQSGASVSSIGSQVPLFKQ